jgi:hypothetical protein
MPRMAYTIHTLSNGVKNMFKFFKNLFKKPRVKVIVTFAHGTETAWVSYTGIFDGEKISEYVFENYPTAIKVKIVDLD